MSGSFRMDGHRFACDVGIGLGLFALALITVAGGTSPAGAVQSTVLTLETRWLPLALIAAMFSLFMAFNLALYRHVRRIYSEDTLKSRRSGSDLAS